MSKSPGEEIEELSSTIESFKELKAIVYHQDYVYNKEIIVSLNRLPSDIRDNTIKTFSHFYKTYKNVLAYLWESNVQQKQILNELYKDETIRTKIDELRETLEKEEVEP